MSRLNMYAALVTVGVLVIVGFALIKFLMDKQASEKKMGDESFMQTAPTATSSAQAVISSTTSKNATETKSTNNVGFVYFVNTDPANPYSISIPSGMKELPKLENHDRKIWSSNSAGSLYDGESISVISYGPSSSLGSYNTELLTAQANFAASVSHPQIPGAVGQSEMYITKRDNVTSHGILLFVTGAGGYKYEVSALVKAPASEAQMEKLQQAVLSFSLKPL